jgi:hypothetical protein
MTDPTALQATLVDFALTELVRQHRDSFPPLWTSESWAKLLIWLALNCGCSSETAALEAFAAALGPALTRRLRRVYFERELNDLNLQLMADPAEQQVLALPLDPLASPGRPDLDQVALALQQVGLADRLVTDRDRWQALEGLWALPWAP